MKKRWLLAATLCLAALILGIVIGRYLIPAGTRTSDPSHAHRANEHMVHSHGMVEVDPSQAIPSVDLIVHPDGHGGGWNLELRTENFVFAPERSGLGHVPGQGHAHLYIDGVKITRIYGPWFFLGPENLETGEHELKVTLNANDHSDYMLEGLVIGDSETFIVFQE